LLLYLIVIVVVAVVVVINLPVLPSSYTLQVCGHHGYLCNDAWSTDFFSQQEANHAFSQASTFPYDTLGTYVVVVVVVVVVVEKCMTARLAYPNLIALNSPPPPSPPSSPFSSYHHHHHYYYSSILHADDITEFFEAYTRLIFTTPGAQAQSSKVAKVRSSTTGWW